MQFPDMKLDSYEMLPGGAIKKNGETMVPMQIMVPEELKIKFDRANSNWICEKCLGLSYDLIGFEEKTPGYYRPTCWCCGVKPSDDKGRMHYITPGMLLRDINYFCKTNYKALKEIQDNRSCRDIT